MSHVIWFVVNKLLHPLIRLVIPTEKMKRILPAAAVRHYRVKLKDCIEVLFRLDLVSPLEVNLSAHEVYICILLVQVYSKIIALHRLVIVSGELVAPALCIVSEGIQRIHLDSLVKDLNGLCITTRSAEYAAL